MKPSCLNLDNTATLLALLEPDGRLRVANPASIPDSQVRDRMVGIPLWLAPWWEGSPLRQAQVEEAVGRAARGETVSFMQSCTPDEEAAGMSAMGLTFRPIHMPGEPVHTLLVEASLHNTNLGSYQSIVEQTTRTEAHFFSNDAYYRCVVNMLEEGIIVLDLNGLIVACNPAACRLLRQPKDNLLQRSLLNNSWNVIHEDGSEYPWEEYPALLALTTGEVYRQRVMGVKHGNGNVSWLSVTATPIILPGDDLPNAVMVSFTDITAAKESQDRLHYLTTHDTLTLLPNRHLLIDRMEQDIAVAKRRQSLMAVIWLDIDGFKPLNEGYGHSTGDSVLIEVARRLRELIRAGDTAARIGGDEFVLVINELANHDELERVTHRIAQWLVEPIQLGELTLHIQATMGVTLFPTDGATPDTLLRNAEQAMYTARQQGVHHIHLFDAASSDELQRQQQLLERIYHGIQHGEFELFYQPKINMRSGKVIGVEALMRWQHPEQGTISPAHFLPRVEDHELEIQLGLWSLDAALAQAARWQLRGCYLPISVNISSNFLLHPQFVAQLSHRLAQYPQLPQHTLELEIQECTALQDINRVRDIINTCTKLGVSFALDDFGTGYSSLTYLRTLPAQTLKLDQHFVREMLEHEENLSIIEATLAMTRVFKRQVIAEGVETIGHSLLLFKLGCDVIQGFSVAHPMNAEELEQWLLTFEPETVWQTSLSFQWSRQDYRLLEAESLHSRWLKNFLHSLDHGTPLPEDMQPHECAFGRWLQRQGQQEYGHLESFLDVVRLHGVFHQHANQLAEQPEPQAALRQTLLKDHTTLLDALYLLQADVSDMRYQHSPHPISPLHSHTD